MKLHTLIGVIAIVNAALASATAATVNWSASVDHGFSSADGSSLPAGSLVQLGWFRDPVTQEPLTDAQIQAVAGQVSLLEARFVVAGSAAIGSGLSGLPEHFSASSTMDTATQGLVGRQMYLWVLNAATAAAATQQAILYWDIADATNPDGSPIRPQLRWAFPAELPVPGSTSIDLTDLTTGSSGLGTGAKVVIGSYPLGTSDNTAAPNFGLVPISNQLVINTGSPIVTGVRNTAYDQTLVASGGAEPLTWSISSGSLPAGLTLNPSTGNISGTPTTTGISSFTVQVEDNAALVGSKNFTLEIAEAPLSIITPESLVDGLLDQPYQLILDSDGGSTPHTWSHTAGVLPPGLVLTTAGELSGVLTAVGTYNFQLTVTDVTAQRAQRYFSLNVTHAPSILGGSSLVPGVVRLGYSHQFVAADPRPYVWTVTAGTLPAGLTLSNSGLLKGTPTTAGSSTFTVKAQGASGSPTSREFSLTILSTNVAPTLQIPTIPETSVGDNGFRQRIIASPYPSTISAVGLPPGLVINPKTGWITGKATRAGVFVATIKATNAAGSSPVEYVIFRVKALQGGAIGTFHALVSPVQEVNLLLGGRIDLTTTITGSYTLTLTQGSAVIKNAGTLKTDPASLNPRVIATVGNLKLNLILDSSTQNLTGSLSFINAAGTPIPAAVNGWRQTWSNTFASDGYAGFYTTALNLANNIDIETVPQGSGAVWVIVSRLGATLVAGRTATGDLITTPGILAADGRVLLYSRQNANLGVIQGVFRITPNANITRNRISGDAIWRKGNSITNIYPSAFGPVSITATGGWMGNSQIVNGNVIQYTGGQVLGLPAPAVPSSITFTKGGLAGAAIKPDVNPFTFRHTVINKEPAVLAELPAPGSLFNPTALTLGLRAKTGFFSGDFKLLDNGKRRVATFHGAIIRTPDDSFQAVGYFLLPKLLQLGETGKPQILSGKVVITQP